MNFASTVRADEARPFLAGKRAMLATASVAMLGIALAQPAFAQDAAAPSPQAEQTPEANASPQATEQASPTSPVAGPSTSAIAEGAPVAGQEIVVTGSRIARKDYTANSPIVTVDNKLLEQSSTAAIEQNLNKLPQFAPAKTPTGANTGDIQPTATNTPGSANISLRGLGANRNLVLLDGRRATPSNATGVVDINTIPSAAVERVEIITGGASATYGADAIGGVANFILKKNFKGLELDAQTNISQRGDGFEYQVSGIMGADFDDGRGNVSIAMSTNKRKPMYQAQRPWYRENWSDPTIGGSAFFPPAAGVSAAGINPNVFFSVFNQANPVPQSLTLRQGADPSLSSSYSCTYGTVTNPIDSGLCVPFNVGSAANPLFVNVTAGITGFSVYANPDGTAWTGTGYAQRGGAYRTDNVDGFNLKQTSIGTIGANDTYLYAQLPLERYNFFARGNYEISDDISIFGQGLYSHVHTHTVQEGGPIVGGWSVSIPYGNAIYAPSVGNADYQAGGRFGLSCPTTGCPTYQVFPLPAEFQKLMLGRGTTVVGTDNQGNAIYDGANAPVSLNYLFPQPRENDTDVDTFNLTAGIQGKVPNSDWTYEIFTNYGESSTYAIQTGVISLNRLRALFNSPNWGQGFRASSNTGDATNFGGNTATCTSGYNIFNPAQAVSADCLNAIRADLKNRSKIRQNIWEADAQGTLFNLPAGELKVALGASYRATDFSFTNDTLTTQGVSFQDQALGIYPSGDTTGRITAKEVYGELLVPVLRDTFIKSLDLELGGRISKYNTTGTSYTYKALADLQATNWLRFRGGYNRAERAPNIAELYLSPQQSFATNALGDICSQRSTFRISGNSAASAVAGDVRAVCSAVMDRTAGAGQGAAYYAQPVAQQPAPGGGFSFPTLVGNPNLTPEKADTYTAGVVINSPFQSEALRRLRLSVDWFQIKIKDAIGFSPGATLQQCFDPVYNPLVSGAAGSAAQATAAAASAQCAGVAYQPGPSGGAPGIGNILMTYTNAGTVDISGIDAQLDWTVPVGPGSVFLNVVGSYYLHYKVAELSANPLVDYTGTFGTTSAGLSGAAFEWRTLTTLGYNFGGASISLQWQHTPKIEDAAEPLAANPITGAPAYNLFNLAASYAVTRDVVLRLGVDNLLDKEPPLTGINTGASIASGQLPGGSFQSTYYDDLGRRFYFGVKAKF